MEKGERLRRNFRLVVWASLVSLLFGLIIGWFKWQAWGALKGAAIGFFISFAVAAFRFLAFQERFRKLSFPVVVLVYSLVDLVLTVSIYLIISWLFIPVIPLAEQMGMLGPAIAITAGAALLANLIYHMNRLLGRRVLLNFITGRYYRPVEEERIFMFLDIAGSTTIAEKIGHLKFHGLLRDFFFDMTEPILASRGEIYKYVGDEAIVVWKMEEGLAEGRCLKCYFDIVERLDRRREKYNQKFGVFPEFRAGFHCGPVVAGEMGDYKMEIAFLGDVVNTAARIQGECRVLGYNLLFSEDLEAGIRGIPGLQTRPAGRVRLRGKEREMELFTADLPA